MQVIIPWSKKISILKDHEMTRRYSRRYSHNIKRARTVLVKWQILTSDNEPHLIVLTHVQVHDGIAYKTCTYKHLAIDGFENNSGKSYPFKFERKIGADTITVFTEFVYITKCAPVMRFNEKNDTKCFTIWKSRYMFMIYGYTRKIQPLVKKIIPTVVIELLSDFVAIADVWEFQLIEEHQYRLTINGINYIDAVNKWKSDNL
eukprot:170187_1